MFNHHYKDRRIKGEFWEEPEETNGPVFSWLQKAILLFCLWISGVGLGYAWAFMVFH
jgi:hypothetical protein